jgi:tetratricopeptide (TPR) repeat protein
VVLALWGAAPARADFFGVGESKPRDKAADQKARQEAARSVAQQTAVQDQIARLKALVAEGKVQEACPALLQMRQTLKAMADRGKAETLGGLQPKDLLPQVDALLARVALAVNQPDKALEFVEPYAQDRSAYNDKWSDAYLATGDAYLAKGDSYAALVLLDWMAGNAQGEPLARAAEACGRALLARKEYSKALDAFQFALRCAQEFCYEDADLLKRIRDLIAKAKRLADIDLYGEDFVRYRDAERLRREQNKPAAARPIYLEIIQKWPEGPYAEASRLYAAKCLIEMGKVAEAAGELNAFRKADPYGLYRGEAALELGRIALEHYVEPKAAKGCFLLLDTWLETVTKERKEPLNIEKLAVREAAGKVTTPPQAEWGKADFWGNVKKNRIQPGQLVNRKTCPWYLDDLKEQCAMYLGFLCFVEGDKEGALASYKRILECDPETRRLDTSGEWNDYSRLKWGAEHGYLYAYPQELKALPGERQRLATLLVDFHYITQHWDEARAMARRLVDGEFGMLKGPAREYPQYVYAATVFRTQGRDKAVPEYLKVLGNPDEAFKTFTQCRAAYAAANLGRESADEKMRAQSRALLVRLVQTRPANSETYKARIVLAKDLVQEGRRDEGLALLRTFPKDAGDYKALADYYVDKYTHQEDH